MTHPLTTSLNRLTGESAALVGTYLGEKSHAELRDMLND
jgi:hypothetical protein